MFENMLANGKLSEYEADKLFEELGYKITEEVTDDFYNNGIKYTKQDKYIKKNIEFYYYHKQIEIYTEQIIDGKTIRWKSVILDMQVLKAINKKVEELRWI